MQSFIRTYAAFVCTMFYLSMLHAQVNEGTIEVNASFESYIELRFVDNPVVTWEFSSIQHYDEAYYPLHREIDFQVSSSTSFLVQISATDMASPAGDILDYGNLGWRMGARPAHASEMGNRWHFTKGDDNRTEFMSGSQAFSGLFLARKTPFTIITPGPDGNAGDFAANEFFLRIGLGAKNIRNLSKLPILLRQAVKPGVYSGSLTLYAIASY